MLDLFLFLGGIGVFFLFGHFCKKNQNYAIDYFVFEDGLITNIDEDNITNTNNINNINSNNNNELVPPLYDESQRLPSYDELSNNSLVSDI